MHAVEGNINAGLNIWLGNSNQAPSDNVADPPLGSGKPVQQKLGNTLLFFLLHWAAGFTAGCSVLHPFQGFL